MKKTNKKDTMGGLYIKIDPTYLQYVSNLIKIQREQYLDNLLHFSYIYLEAKRNNPNFSDKEIQNAVIPSMKIQGHPISRATYYRYKQRITLQPVWAKFLSERKKAIAASKKAYEDQKRRRISHEEFEKAINSPTAEPGPTYPIANSSDRNHSHHLLAKALVEQHFNELGSKIVKGRTAGSKEGGKTTKRKFI